MRELRIVLRNTPKIQRTITGKLTVDLYVRQWLRLRRNIGYKNVPEYSIIIGNAERKRQIPVPKIIWKELVGIAAKLGVSLIAVKRGLGHVHLGKTEAYIEKVTAIDRKNKVGLTVGEIEICDDEKVGAENLTDEDLYTIMKHALEESRQDSLRGEIE